MKNRIKSFFAYGKPVHKKWWFYITLLLILGLLIAIPFIINESYKHGGYVTIWRASDVLLFYGSCLAFIGTVSLGALALWQNKKANNINNNLTKANLIAINKPNIKVRKLDILFDNTCVNVNLHDNYNQLLVINGTKNVSGMYNCINIKLSFKTDIPIFVTKAKIKEVTIYYTYVTIDKVGSDEYPGYCLTDGLSGGFCNEIGFSNIISNSDGKFSSVDCLESGNSVVDFFCLIDFIATEKEYFRNIESINIQNDFLTDNYQKIKNEIFKSKKIVIFIKAELLNNFDIVTKGDFQFKFEISNSKLTQTSKLFIPRKYDYYDEKHQR